MINQFAIVSAKILTKLQALTKTKFVYAYEKGQIEGYPAITVYGSEYYAEIEDNMVDRDTYVFTLHLYQEQEVKTPAETEQIINDALVECFQAFQSDFTLGGTVDIMKLKAVKGWVNREVVNRVAVITLTLSKLNPII